MENDSEVTKRDKHSSSVCRIYSSVRRSVRAARRDELRQAKDWMDHGTTFELLVSWTS